MHLSESDNNDTPPVSTGHAAIGTATMLF